MRKIPAIVLWIAIIIVLCIAIICANGAQWRGSEWNKNVSVKNTATGGFIVDLPQQGGHINIVRRSQKSVPLGGKITVTYRCKVMSGKPKIISLDPAPAPPSLKPNFRPALFDGDWYGANGRWWTAGANCMFIIPDGVVRTYTTKIKPNLWTNVWGKYDAGGFKRCARHMKEFWFAWGGGNSFTHGLAVKNGKIRVEVIDVKFND